MSKFSISIWPKALLAGMRLRTYARALKINPELPAAVYNHALLLEQQGSTFDAENLYEQLVNRQPDCAEAWFRLGYLRLERGDSIGAARAFESSSG